MSEFNPADLNDTQLMQKYEEMTYALETIDAGIRVVRDEMLDRLIREGIKGKNVLGYALTYANIHSYPGLTIEQARELGATKTEVKETIDTGKIKALIRAGAPIQEETMPRLTIRHADKGGDD